MWFILLSNFLSHHQSPCRCQSPAPLKWAPGAALLCVATGWPRLLPFRRLGHRGERCSRGQQVAQRRRAADRGSRGAKPALRPCVCCNGRPRDEWRRRGTRLLLRREAVHFALTQMDRPLFFTLTSAV